MLSTQDLAAGWALCEPHRNPVHPTLGYCGQCTPSEPTNEPDYDLMGKYERHSDSHLDDPAATAQVGYGWRKGV